jgi:hypothetical protein
MKRLVFLSAILFLGVLNSFAVTTVMTIKGHPIKKSETPTHVRILCQVPLDQTCAILYNDTVCIPDWDKCYVVTNVTTKNNSDGSTDVYLELPFNPEQ